MTAIWGYLKFCWYVLDFDRYEYYNLPCVTTCPDLSYQAQQSGIDLFNL